MSGFRDTVPFRYAVVAGANLVGAGCGFVVMLLIARQFGPEGLGQVSIALALLAYGLEVTTCGTNLLAVARTAGRPDTISAVVAAVVTIRFGLSLIVYPMLLVLPLLVPSFSEAHALIAVYGLVLFANAVNPLWVPQALHASHVYAANGVAAQGLTLLFVAAAVGLGAGLWSVAASRTAAEFLVAGGLVLWVVRRTGRVPPPRDYAAVGRFAVASAPFGGTQILRSLALTADPILLALLVSTAELGYYASAYRIFLLLTALASAYFAIQLPRMAERSHDPGALAGELRQSLWRTVPVALAAAAGLAVIAGPALPLLFGAGFAAAVPALQLLGAAAVVSVVNRHYRQVLLARGRGPTDLWLTAVATAVHVLGTVVLAAALGIVGAALGTLLGEAFLAIALRRAALKELTDGGSEGGTGADRVTVVGRS